jgi:hypothetical protein
MRRRRGAILARDGRPELDGIPRAGTRQGATVLLPTGTVEAHGVANNGFRNIIVINGHGGPQTAILNELAEKTGRAHRVRTLVVNWWVYCSDVTVKVFGEDGGHAAAAAGRLVGDPVPVADHTLPAGPGLRAVRPGQGPGVLQGRGR